MKWIWSVLLGLLAPLLVLALFAGALYRPGLPIAAQNALNSYLAEQAALGQNLQVRTVSRAPHRQSLVAQASRASFGNDYYFSTNGRALPYPPTEVWCATLDGSRGEPHIVLVAEHEDMHVAGWFVHEPASQDAAGAICR